MTQLIAAVDGASAKMDGHLQPARPEARLEKLLLDDLGRLGCRAGARKEHVGDVWKHVGGIDLYAYPQAPGAHVLDWIAELKVDRLDESLWDLVKLASGLGAGIASEAFLVLVAQPSVWERVDAIDLYPTITGPAAKHTLAALIFHQAELWESMLRYSEGRPITCPRRISTDLIDTWPGWLDTEMRLIKVEVLDAELLRFDDDGWPQGVYTDEIKDVLKNIVKLRKGGSALKKAARLPDWRLLEDAAHEEIIAAAKPDFRRDLRDLLLSGRDLENLIGQAAENAED